MENKDKKSLAGAIGFAVLQIMFLWNNFSVLGCVFTALMFLVVILKTIVKKNESIYAFTANMPVFCSICLLNIAAVTFFYNMNSALIGEILDTNSHAFQWILFLSIALVIAGHISDAIFGGKVWTYIKYILVGVVEYFLPQIIEVSFPETYSTFVIIFNIVFLSLTVIERNYNVKHSFSFGVGVCTFAVILLTFFVNSSVLLEFFDAISSANVSISWSIIKLLLIIAVFIAVGVVCFIFDKENTSQESFVGYQDTSSALAIGFDVVFLMVLDKISSEFNYLFVVLMFIINVIVFMVKGGNTKKKLFSKIDLDDKICFVIFASVVTILMAAAFVRGFADTILMGAFVVVSIIGFNKYKYKFNVILCAIMLLAADLAYHWYNTKQVFVFIIFFFLISNIILIGFTIQNPRYEITKTMSNWIVVFVFLILSIFPVFNNGISCSLKDYDSENSEVTSNEEKIDNQVMIDLKARGKKNNISKIDYYWESEPEVQFVAKLDENDSFCLDKKQDTLVICCYDVNGTKSVHRYIFGGDTVAEPVDVQ